MHPQPEEAFVEAVPKCGIPVENQIENQGDDTHPPCNFHTSKQFILEHARQHLKPHLPSSEFGEHALEKGMAMLMFLFDSLALRPLTPSILGLVDDAMLFPKHDFWTRDVSSYLDVQGTKQLLKCLVHPQHQVSGISPLVYSKPIPTLSGEACIMSEYEFQSFSKGLYDFLEAEEHEEEGEKEDWSSWMIHFFVVEDCEVCGCVRS